MPEVDFADGFDVSEPLLWGLTPAQLGTVVGGAILAYLALRSPLPVAAGVAIGVAAVGAALAVTLVRVEGRTLLSWMAVAARYRARPHHGMLALGADGDGPATGPGPCRVPLVLVPEPAGGVADAAQLEAPVRPRGTGGWESRLEPGLRATRRITFFSMAGGSGRSTLAAEVAGLLASRSALPWAGPAIALMDLDLGCPRASLRLGVPLHPEWAEVVAAVPPSGALDRLLQVHRTGLRVLPGPAGVPVGWLDDRQLPARLSWLLGEVERQGCEVIVLDVPAGLGRVTRWALDAAHDVFVVLTPTAGGVQDAYRSTEALRRLGHARKIRHVANRAGGARVFTEAMQDLGGTIVAVVPEDPTLVRAEAQHRLLGVEGAGSTARALRSLAATVDARLAAPPGRLGMGRRLLRRRAG